MLKKIIFILCTIAIFFGTNSDKVKEFGKTVPTFTDISENFSWAKDAILSLSEIGAISAAAENTFLPQALVSKEQLAKMLFFTFNLDSKKENPQKFADVADTRWSYRYISACAEFFPKNQDLPDHFYPENACTREDLAVICAKILGTSYENYDSLNSLYSDFSLVREENKPLFAAVVNKSILSADGSSFYPQREVTRAEACVILKRAEEIKNGNLNQNTLSNKIVGKSEISLSQALSWAEGKNADKRFLDVAPLYWEYGEKTGIRPEVLYAQAAKETNYGKYTGSVTPSQNNWAGIKTVAASGDEAFDHESFESPEDGVRGHFNHMCAYVGLAPIGEPHERFYKTSTAAWAGKVANIEDLGGKWAPAKDYGESILNDYLKPMSDIDSVN